MDRLKALKTDRHTAILLTAVAVYTLVFSYATVWKHDQYYSYAWDLGVFNQAMYSTAFGGGLLTYTCDGYMNINGSYFAIHFSPILLLLLPLYVMFPHPSLLLIIKTAALAAAAVPLYKIAEKSTTNRDTALIIAVTYLAYPGIQAANWYDFQPQALVPLLVFTAYLMLLEEKWAPYLASTTLALMVEEHIFLVVAATIAGYLIAHRDQTRRLLNPKDRLTQALVATVLLSVTLLAASALAKNSNHINPEFKEVYEAAGGYRVLGYTGSAFGLPLHVALNPAKAYQALLYDADLKLAYLLFLYAPLLFLPATGPSFLATIPLFVPFLLSNYRAYYTLGAHYSLYVAPNIFTAYILALRGLTDRKNLTRLSLVMTIALAAALSPVSPISQAVNQGGRLLWYPAICRPQAYVDNLDTLVDVVPDGAAVLTQSHVFPHLSSNANAYTTPIMDFGPEANKAAQAYVDTLIDKCQYVLIDFYEAEAWSIYVHSQVKNSPDWGVYAYLDNAVLYQRGLESTPLGLENHHTRTYRAATDLHTSGVVTVWDEGRPVALIPKASPPGITVYGPYSVLPSGSYRVTATVRAEDPDEGLIGYLQVARDQGTEVARRMIWSQDASPQWFNVSLTFTLPCTQEYTEYRIYTTGRSHLYVDTITITGLRDGYPVPCATRSLGAEDLPAPDAQTTTEGYLRSHRPTKVLWYGPYLTLAPGRYAAHYVLRAETPLSGPGPALTLDVAAGRGARVLNATTLQAENLATREWVNVTLTFTLTQEAEVELRGLAPAQGETLTLREVTLAPLRRRPG
ncbi:DUF2079 domain-containing protein [Candidatus Bathyarchaeota archaeon]|nr:DUF2079 domain-containing protein [Candidatus Bathyarchaeota archaeon]